MTDSTFWLLLTGATIALELLSGTFYLLMLALGLAAAALAAYAGWSMQWQVSTAAIVGGGAVALWYFVRSKQAKGESRNLSLDVGETVQVNAWNADGTASVQYRGASWTVVAAAGTTPSPGTHRVREVVGSRLVVEKI